MAAQEPSKLLVRVRSPSPASVLIEFLAADPDVDDAAQQLFDVVDDERGDYDAARDRFIDAAGRSLE